MRQRRAGLSLVELMTVIAIMGVLASLLLPAIQAAREAARRSRCQNKLKQLGAALLLHHDSIGAFPCGGWGHEWVAIPGRGSGPDQPGSWAYGILPFIEQQALHALGAAGDDDAYSRRIATPLSLFTCPTRRPSRAWPVSPRYPYMLAPRPRGASQHAARSDYAINAGATLTFNFRGPTALDWQRLAGFSWPALMGPPNQPELSFTGVSHLRASCRLGQITDGASHCYLVGEKYLDPEEYATGESLGDNESLYSGYCSDNHRFTALGLTPTQDGSILPDPQSNAVDPSANYRFGSGHPAGTSFVYCDGSVRLVSYDVDASVHYLAGHIADEGRLP
jgi:prepilin-type N-terminal cleavage/methylation domain-containing protein